MHTATLMQNNKREEEMFFLYKPILIYRRGPSPHTILKQMSKVSRFKSVRSICDR